MTEQVQQHIKVADADEIDLRELFSAIWAGKWVIIATTFLFSVAAVFYALSLPNIYKSEVTLAPAGERGGLNIPGQLGGLAALAGVNLGGKGGDKTALALEILKSREFLGRFIEENDLYVPIMAAKGWDRASDKLLIDPEIYNEETKQWVREVKEPFKPKPSVLETIEEFTKLLGARQDETTGMVSISIEYYSPKLAKKWVDKLVKSINEDMRLRDLEDAEKSIAYLNSQIEQTTLADIKTMLFSLIEEQTKTRMLANVRDEYVLRTIDSAVEAEKKSSPKRALIIFITLIFGLISSAMYVSIKFIAQKN
jgi:uncharacterized protein involved in exopolysaccharide biosynthesis